MRNVSEISTTKVHDDVLEKVQQGKRLKLVRSKQTVGYIFGAEDPAIMWFDIEDTQDEVLKNEKRLDAALSKSWLQSFKVRHGGVEAAKEDHRIDRLLGLEGSKLMRELPGNDHYTLWLKDGEPHLYTIQPYGMNFEALGALKSFCDKYGLTCAIERRGWYNPGVSILIVLRKNPKRRTP